MSRGLCSAPPGLDVGQAFALGALFHEADHVGLDVESTAILNALYVGETVEPARLQRMVSLFRLDFSNPAEMRADLAGKPVYLGLAMTADHTLKLKPQNLLLNLPLAPSM